MRTLSYRLNNLLRRFGLLVFVLDGPDRPRMKRDKMVGGIAAKPQEQDLIKLLDLYGIPWMRAPGEAEAQLAYMNEQGDIDAVLSDDVDALVFGAHIVIRNNPKTPHPPTASQASKSVDLDDEDDAPLFLKDGETAFYYLASIIDVCGLDKAGMILVALLAGGDYNTIGIRSIGIKAAVRLAKLGYGKTLLEATSGCKTHTPASLARCAAWRELAAQELETTGIEGQDGARLAAAVNLRGAVDFPGMKILRNYTDPVIKKDYPPIDWNREINLVGLVNYYQQTFEWNHQRVINSLRNNLFEAIAVREIRRHALIVDSRKDLAGLTQASKTKPPSYTASPIYSTKELLWVAVHDEKKAFATDQVRSYRVELNPKIFLDVILPALPAVDPFPFESGDEAAPPSSASNSGSPAKGSPFKRSQSTVLSPFKGTPTKKKRPVEPTGRTEVSHWIPVSVFEMADEGPELIAAYREKEAAKTKKKEAVLERKRSKDAGEMVPRAKAKPKAKAATKGKGKAKLMESEDDSDASGYASSRTLTSSVPLDLSPFTIKKRTRAAPIAAYDSDDELPAPFNPNSVANFLTKRPTPSPSHSSVPQRSASRTASPHGSPTKIRKIPPQVIDLTDSDDEDQDLTPMPKGRMIDLLMANKNKAGGSRTPGGKDWKQVEVVVIDSD